MSNSSPSIAVHGGAGARDPATLPAARAACGRAAAAGLRVLSQGGSALDAAEAAVRVLEDEPLLNAGHGSVLNAAGFIEVDAAIMSGDGLRAGAVGSLANVRHPVQVARRILEDGRFLFLVGSGALDFARRHGIAPDTPDDLVTSAAVQRYVAALAERAGRGQAGNTVGAVARDALGHVAAATSTGGTSFKPPGRVGDTPLIGCGTYADDRSGAASATGHGENIIRVVLAKRALDLIAGGMEPAQAGRGALAEMAERTGGEGGLILVDTQGRVVATFTSAHMPFALAERGGDVVEGC
jgi:beta-aspartyl-peptidase (threonine type)